jgi:hypothetical protein
MRRFSRSPVLSSRELGADVRRRLRQAIAEQPPETTADLCFDGVHDMSFAFADEAIAKLIVARLLDDDESRSLIASHATADVADAIDAALTPKGLVLFCVSEGSPRLLGDAAPHLEQTMLAAYELRTFSAPSLAEHLGIKPAAANNRLKALLRCGALARRQYVPERGGNEYRYLAPTAPAI